MANSDRLGEAPALLELIARKGRRNRGEGDRSLAENIVGDPDQKSAVGTPREGDERRFHFRNGSLEIAKPPRGG